MRRLLFLSVLVASLASANGEGQMTEHDGAARNGHVTGIGGVFVASKDPKALAAWYRDVLGMPVESWGGVIFRSDAPGSPARTTWAAMPAGGYFAPSRRELMLNLAVDDLDALAAKLETKHVPILQRQDDETGRFAWIMDPDGTKVELWQPKR